MNAFGWLNYIAAAFLFAVSLWCILSPRYEDGIVGKLIFSVMALSCYATIVAYPNEPNELTHVVMTTSMAAAAVRELWIKRIWPFMRKVRTR